MTEITEISKKRRYETLDLIRGAAILSMMAYHTSWDLVRMFGVPWTFFDSKGADLWQQSICWTFILLSGFCWPLGKKHMRHGLTVFLMGALITAATLVFLPEDPIIFGILTLIGFSMLIAVPLEPLMKKIHPAAGAAGCFTIFLVFYHLNEQVIAFSGKVLFVWPSAWFRGYFMTFLGFQDPEFVSADYFSVLPWSFLFLTGIFLCLLFKKKEAASERKSSVGGTSEQMPSDTAEQTPSDAGDDIPKKRARLLHVRCAPVNFIGRHSLLIYMLHQPVIYGILLLVFRIKGS